MGAISGMEPGAANKVAAVAGRTRLQRIEGWESRARQTRYHVDALAQTCAVSTRQLQRFFVSRFGKPPKLWLRDLRLQHALAMLREGKSVKEAAWEVGLAAPEELSREIKRGVGLLASQIGSLPLR